MNSLVFYERKRVPGYYNAEVFRDYEPLIVSEYLTDAFTRASEFPLSIVMRQSLSFSTWPTRSPRAHIDAPPQVYLDRV